MKDSLDFLIGGISRLQHDVVTSLDEDHLEPAPLVGFSHKPERGWISPMFFPVVSAVATAVVLEALLYLPVGEP